MELEEYFKNLARKVNISDIASYEFSLALDEDDSLKFLRNEFHYPKMKSLPYVDPSLVNLQDSCIYLCGNSLGLMPKCTKNFVEVQLQKWAELGVLGHTEEPLPWAHSDEYVAEAIAKLVGADASEVICMNSLTVNLHTAFYQPSPARHKILIESRSFPSDHYAIESQIQLKGGKVEESLVCMEPREGEECLRIEDVLSFIENHGESVSIIFFSGIQYYTGQLFDMNTITAAVGWNLAHAFGNIPLALHDWDVDFAVWCTYKYGNSSAGGIGGAFVHKRYGKDKRQRMLGWWAHRASTRFLMDNKLDLDDGAAGYRISNPPMMLIAPILGSLQVFAMTTMEELRSKSIKLTGYLEFLINHFLNTKSSSKQSKQTKIKCTIITPKRVEERGCQLSLKFNADIESIYQQLSKRGVVVDKRHPNVIRVAPTHLYNNFNDVYRFTRALVDSLDVLENQHGNENLA
ncbi:unnamed protein product [Dracunculus medinensis]|uniref:Kynureninase n=1 Tax=Dracunculus medinensis TaxID=318479 RepID=A0A0N4UE97_DRAME|nr:unnamed protein product [Dracunculus medinensis]